MISLNIKEHLDVIKHLCEVFTQETDLDISTTVLVAIAKCMDEELTDADYETIFA